MKTRTFTKLEKELFYGLQNQGYKILDTENTSFTRSLTSGTKVGTITINGTATDIYCQTNTDTKVTAVGNHYTPTGGTTTSASGGTVTDITNGTGVQVVTGVTKDAAGHVTGVTSVGLKSVNTNTWTAIYNDMGSWL